MTYLSLALLLVPAAMVAMDKETPSLPASTPAELVATSRAAGTAATEDEDDEKLEQRLAGFETSLLAITRNLDALNRKLDAAAAPKSASAASAAAASAGTGKVYKLHADNHLRAGAAAAAVVVAAGVFGPQAAKDFVADLSPDARLALTAGAFAAGTQLTTRVIDGQKRLSNGTQLLGFSVSAIATVWALNAALQAGSKLATRLGDKLNG